MVQVVILAAGLGTRMKSNIPKVLHKVNSQSIISHLIDSVDEAGVCKKPLVVIDAENSLIKKQLGNRCIYVIQNEKRGTGHAVQVCEPRLKEISAQHILVLYGDMPFASSSTIKKLAQTHIKEKNILTLATLYVPNFRDELECFDGFGRIIRGENGHIRGIIEKKDTTSEQRKIKEVNPGWYCFNSQWLWKHISSLKNNNSQHEYYITDMVKIACDQSVQMSSIFIENPFEAIGVNTQHQLLFAKKIFQNQLLQK